MLFTSWVNHLEYSEQLQQSGAEMEVSSLLTPQQTSSHNCQLRADTWKNFHGQKCHDTSPELSSTLRNLKNSTGDIGHSGFGANGEVCMTCDKNVPDQPLEGISQNMAPDLPYCSGFSLPQIVQCCGAHTFCVISAGF